MIAIIGGRKVSLFLLHREAVIKKSVNSHHKFASIEPTDEIIRLFK